MKLALPVVAIAAGVLSLEGCKNAPPPVMAARLLLKGSKHQHGGPIAQGDLLKLTESTSGTATKGEDFKVILTTQADDGDEWQCRTPNDPVLLVDAVFETQPSGKLAAGTEKLTIYHLHARGVGKAKIDFVQVNTRNKNVAPVKTLTLTVEVTNSK